MTTLVPAASTSVGDCAVLDGDAVLAAQSVAMKGAEHVRLMTAVVSALAVAKVGVAHIDRVVCGAGRWWH